jgi:hypothetical protein
MNPEHTTPMASFIVIFVFFGKNPIKLNQKPSQLEGLQPFEMLISHYFRLYKQLLQEY